MADTPVVAGWVIPNWYAKLTKAYSTYASGAAILALVAEKSELLLTYAPILQGLVPDWAVIAILVWGLIGSFIPQASVTNPAAAPVIAPPDPATEGTLGVVLIEKTK